MDSEPDVNADLDSALEESAVKATQTAGSTPPKLNLPRPGEQADQIGQKPFPTVPTPPSVRVKKLYQLVGQAVLLPIPYGQKGPRTEGWQQVTFEQSCELRGNTQRAGLQRRFLPYVAEGIARKLRRPQPDGATVNGLIKQFSLLTHLRGAFSWTLESEKLFDDYKDKIDARILACDILDDRTRGRLTTACAWVAKIAMIFEASVLCYNASWMPRDPEIVPTSPPLILHHEMIQLAIEHVEECLKAAALLDSVANRKSIAEQAEVLLTYVRTRFGQLARDGSIVLTRTQITDTYAHNASRRSDSPVSDIYDRLIPHLIRAGEAQLLTKDAKKEIYAFRAEESV